MGRLSSQRLLQAHYAAAAALAELVRSIDRTSPVGKANVYTVLNHPEFGPLRTEANRLYRECCARGLLT